MRVAFVTTHYWPSLGGVERVAMNLADACRAEGHSVRVVAKRFDEKLLSQAAFVLWEGPRATSYLLRGVEVCQLPLSMRSRCLLLPFALEVVPVVGRLPMRRLRRRNVERYADMAGSALALLLEGTDLVHVLGTGLIAPASIKAAHRLGLPVAMTPFAHPAPAASEARWIPALRAADAVLATVEADAARYLEYGVERARLHVCGVPVPSLPQAEPGSGPHIPSDVPLVLFLGARRAAKGWRLLLDSAPHVWTRFPETRFAFVGPGVELSAHDDRVLALGRVSDGERAAWIRRATILCLPSTWESFGLVVAEAWSEAVPVVVSDAPVLRELVHASQGGLVSERSPQGFAAAITELLARPDRARELGHAGRAFWALECNPQVVARRHLALYEELVRSKDRAPMVHSN